MLIKNKESLIKDLEELLGTAKNQKKELERAFKIITNATTPARKAVRKRKKGISVPDAIEEILKRVGKPMHVKELSENIGVAATNITASLQRYVKQGRRFSRTAPGTFGLIVAAKKKAMKKVKTKTSKKASKKAAELKA